MTKRNEFSPSVRMKAWERSGGACEHPGCTIKLRPGGFQYDHIIPDGLGGEPTLENCMVLCTAHHEAKTHGVDRPLMAKADRIKKKHIAAERAKKPWPKPINPWGKPWPSRTRRVET